MGPGLKVKSVVEYNSYLRRKSRIYLHISSRYTQAADGLAVQAVKTQKLDREEENGRFCAQWLPGWTVSGLRMAADLKSKVNQRYVIYTSMV